MGASNQNEDINKAINAKVESEFKAIRDKAEVKLVEDVDKFRKGLESDLKKKSLAQVLAVVSLSATILIGGMYTQTVKVNSAVIALQKDIISAQKVIKESADELQKAKNDLRDAESKLRLTNDQLLNTKNEYEKRLKELQQEYNKKASLKGN